MTIADGRSLSAIFSILSISLVYVYICIHSWRPTAPSTLPNDSRQIRRTSSLDSLSILLESAIFRWTCIVHSDVYLCFPYHFVIIDNIVKAFCRKQWVITIAIPPSHCLSFFVTTVSTTVDLPFLFSRIVVSFCPHVPPKSNHWMTLVDIYFISFRLLEILTLTLCILANKFFCLSVFST